jgi:hypothetical protein
LFCLTLIQGWTTNNKPTLDIEVKDPSHLAFFIEVACSPSSSALSYMLQNSSDLEKLFHLICLQFQKLCYQTKEHIKLLSTFAHIIKVKFWTKKLNINQIMLIREFAYEYMTKGCQLLSHFCVLFDANPSNQSIELIQLLVLRLSRYCMSKHEYINNYREYALFC